ncbi:hypothetical protein COV17_01030 [Candidatus Woesearchaeota archaeon CG10_big_fil_rev_8_21_14_0_10_36_11]|nr:MAG: hypothetical protein COV17_01030 [Candidatus Woesearchaeota archaeon CG10_big_fil_rev_8_21_14_0_10_36_11]
MAFWTQGSTWTDREMVIEREQIGDIEKVLDSGVGVALLVAPRQTGKTTHLKLLRDKRKGG